MLNVTTPEEQFSSLAGYIQCKYYQDGPITWNLTLQDLSSTNHNASLVKRTGEKVWETTLETPRNMCSNSKNLTRLPGSPDGDVLNITHDCQALQSKYNSSNEGYWNVTFDDDSVNYFVTLDSQGDCALLFIVLDRPTLPITFQ